MNTSPKQPKQDEFIDELTARQENLTWPNYQINSRGVDELLLKGGANPTRVQRIGIWLFGLTFIGLGLSFFGLAQTASDNQWGPGTIGLAILALGGWICYNGSRSRQPPAQRRERL